MMSHWFKFFQQKDRKPACYFAHIPKTAGTSFIVLLDRFYQANQIYPHQLWRDAGCIDVVDNNKYRLYRGHFGGGGVDVLTDRPLTYLTILRNPHSLALSTYQFVKRESNTKVHQLLNELNMSFSDFLGHPMTQPLVQNRMVRNLSFDFKKDPAAQEVFLSAETIEYLQPIIQNHNKPISESKRLQRAKAFIKRCHWFGLLERFEESLQLLCYQMHWPPFGQTQKLNTHNNKIEFKDQEMSLLSKVNQQDSELYAFSEAVFVKKVQQMKHGLQRFMSQPGQGIDELLDLSYQHHHAKKVANSLNVSFKYGFDQILLGNQWHRRELMHPENEYFRWTGPGTTSSIDFWLKPQNYDISIRVINATSIDVLNQLLIEINGQQVDWQTSDTGVVRILQLSCPEVYIKDNGLLRLTMTCHSMISHQEAFDSDDERLVGLAVHWIQFKHVS